MIDFSKFNSLIAMTMYFNNNDVCRDAIVEARWGIGEQQDIICPYCGEHHCVSRKDGKFRCNKCKRNFSCKVGTIFEDSNLSLVKWFIAMYLISSHKKGISSYQLARDIKVTQKTAWYMLHKVRALYAQNDLETLCGDLQSYIDEACFRWNTRKISESERFTDMFNTSVGLVKPNREFILCKKVA